MMKYILYLQTRKTQLPILAIQDGHLGCPAVNISWWSRATWQPDLSIPAQPVGGTFTGIQLCRMLSCVCDKT